jgi:hypothetical protein
VQTEPLQSAPPEAELAMMTVPPATLVPLPLTICPIARVPVGVGLVATVSVAVVIDPVMLSEGTYCDVLTV